MDQQEKVGATLTIFGWLLNVAMFTVVGFFMAGFGFIIADALFGIAAGIVGGLVTFVIAGYIAVKVTNLIFGGIGEVIGKGINEMAGKGAKRD